MPPPSPKVGGAPPKGGKTAVKPDGDDEPDSHKEFPKMEIDEAHKDIADKVLIDRVTAEPAESDGHIVVAVRIRPPNQRELDGGAKNIVVHAENSKRIRLDNAGSAPYLFEYDEAIAADSTQEGVFARIGVPIVQDAFHGYNGTMFAYGQTSSGKSFSMIGKLADDMTQGISEAAGIIPRVAHLLFATSHSVPATHEFFVEASFIEIYNEKVRDLLDPSTTELKVRESPKMGVHITGLTKKHVQSSFAVGHVLNTGFQNRTVRASNLRPRVATSPLTRGPLPHL
jgi:kinesin family protein 5